MEDKKVLVQLKQAAASAPASEPAALPDPEIPNGDFPHGFKRGCAIDKAKKGVK